MTVDKNLKSKSSKTVFLSDYHTSMLQLDYRFSSTTMVRRGYLSSSTMMYSNWYFSRSSYNTHTNTQTPSHAISRESEFRLCYGHITTQMYTVYIYHVQEKRSHFNFGHNFAIS